MSQTGPVHPSDRRLWAGIALLVVTAISLRAPIVAVAPLADVMIDELDVSAAMMGTLTGLAVFVFGVLAPASLASSRYVSVDRLIALAMLAIVMGSAVRIVPDLGFLLGGTLVAASGIAFGNILLPAVIRRDFSSRLPLATSVYAATLSAGGALAAALTLPGMRTLDSTWNVALALWSIPAAIALLLWIPRAVRRGSVQRWRAPVALLRSPRVIALSVFMGGQSAIYFTTNAWLPSILRDNGHDPITAGWLLGIVNVCNVAGSALAPLIAGAPRRRAVVAVVIAILAAVSFTALVVFPAVAVPAAILLGAAQGAGLGIALLLIAVLADRPEDVVTVSALVQGVGYLLAAAAPIVIGALFDVTGTWTLPLGAVICFAAMQAVAGRIASRRT